jgi:FAD/FMN-containing dehydrogenase
VLAPGDADYNDARRVWNGLIDRRPSLIVRCDGVSDVVDAVAFARRHRLRVSIRGGGHQIGGSAVCDDGLVIDLSTMTGVHVDPTARTARVQAGARWHHVDRATQLFGLATTGGQMSATGVAGLTLGGGMGLTQRAFGLACDNLRSIEIVTADGVVRTASRHEHPDLFWAACGAGHSIGVVTSFEFDLHPLGPDVAVSQVAYAFTDAEPVLKAWRHVALEAPRTISPQAVLWNLPQHPAVPEAMHGTKVVLVAAVHAGEPGEAAAVLGPFGALGTPLVDLSATMPYTAAQAAFDAFFPDGGRYYFKSHYLDDLTDDAITTLITCDAARPTNETLVGIRALGGAIDDVKGEDSAYPHRRARFNLSLDGVWSDPADDSTVIDWVRHAWTTMQPFANGGVYVNFAGLQDEADITPHALLGPNVERLDTIRADYDPDGVFTNTLG